MTCLFKEMHSLFKKVIKQSDIQHHIFCSYKYTLVLSSFIIIITVDIDKQKTKWESI